jgi:Zn-dependent oligopeptidase
MAMGERPKECPECDSHDTERVHVEWWTDEVQVTRICNDCPTQYDVMYGDPYKRGVRTENE